MDRAGAVVVGFPPAPGRVVTVWGVGCPHRDIHPGDAVTWLQALGGLVVVARIVTAETSRRSTATDPEESLPSPV